MYFESAEDGLCSVYCKAKEDQRTKLARLVDVNCKIQNKWPLAGSIKGQNTVSMILLLLSFILTVSSSSLLQQG